MRGKFQKESGAQHQISGRGFEGRVYGAVTSEDVSAAALKRVIAWQRVKAEAAADEPVAHDAGDLYDPNDPTAVDAFWDAATVRSRGEKHSQR
ncbi:hypothetical protein SAMN04244573_01050 [Azotobacter beijerinckii]|uniref:Uncharacterized protein n=1 Tax=Azotobacter beijerinckii TaxID=170623 RepID=A0A1H9DCX8_9GAMM|nr:hypothetical protein [Azotobacter beijerinckii]SEQ11355.1 hypothetical protein SAMN04244573_01050 [Azotobacter beijerinckii]